MSTIFGPCRNVSQAVSSRRRPLLESPLRVLRVAMRGAILFDPTPLVSETKELRRKALPVGENGRKVLCEVADLAG